MASWCRRNVLYPQRDQPPLMPLDMPDWLPEEDLVFGLCRVGGPERDTANDPWPDTATNEQRIEPPDPIPVSRRTDPRHCPRHDLFETTPTWSVHGAPTYGLLQRLALKTAKARARKKAY